MGKLEPFYEYLSSHWSGWREAVSDGYDITADLDADDTVTGLPDSGDEQEEDSQVSAMPPPAIASEKGSGCEALARGRLACRSESSSRGRESTCCSFEVPWITLLGQLRRRAEEVH